MHFSPNAATTRSCLGAVRVPILPLICCRRATQAPQSYQRKRNERQVKRIDRRWDTESKRIKKQAETWHETGKPLPKAGAIPTSRDEWIAKFLRDMKSSSSRIIGLRPEAAKKYVRKAARLKTGEHIRFRRWGFFKIRAQIQYDLFRLSRYILSEPALSDPELRHAANTILRSLVHINQPTAIVYMMWHARERGKKSPQADLNHDLRKKLERLARKGNQDAMSLLGQILTYDESKEDGDDSEKQGLKLLERAHRKLVNIYAWGPRRGFKNLDEWSLNRYNDGPEILKSASTILGEIYEIHYQDHEKARSYFEVAASKGLDADANLYLAAFEAKYSVKWRDYTLEAALGLHKEAVCLMAELFVARTSNIHITLRDEMSALQERKVSHVRDVAIIPNAEIDEHAANAVYWNRHAWLNYVAESSQDDPNCKKAQTQLQSIYQELRQKYPKLRENIQEAIDQNLRIVQYGRNRTLPLPRLYQRKVNGKLHQNFRFRRFLSGLYRLIFLALLVWLCKSITISKGFNVDLERLMMHDDEVLQSGLKYWDAQLRGDKDNLSRTQLQKLRIQELLRSCVALVPRHYSREDGVTEYVQSDAVQEKALPAPPHGIKSWWRLW